MRIIDRRRLAIIIATATALALPGVAVATDPSSAGRPVLVVDWQTHLAHMQAMSGTLGSQVTDCIAMHDSMAGLFGPNGSMAHLMAAEIVR